MKSKLIMGLWVAVAVLAITTIAFAVAYFLVQGKAKDYEIRLENVYERSFYDLCDNVNNIESNLGKLSASTSDAAKKDLTAKIISQSNMAQNNLATLPIDTNEIGSTVSFVNYVNGYCTMLNQKLGRNQTLTDDELESIDNIYETSKKIKNEVNTYAIKVEGDYKIIDNATSSAYELSAFDKTFSTLKEPSVDYPQLIYDGPFSDSVLNKEIKGLTDPEISQTKADEIVKNYKEVFKYSSYESQGKADGKIPCYDYTLKFADGTRGYLQLTQKGGKVLSYSRNIESGDGKQETDRYTTNAIEFANALGFENVGNVWMEEAQSGVFINLASIIDDVIAYPDLIKVKLSTDKAIITGFEASNYFYNHIERTLTPSTITVDTARDCLQRDLEVMQSRLCIIPNEYVGETFAYEFECEKNGDTYYIYIDANTGEQVQIMRVIQTQDGALLM